MCRRRDSAASAARACRHGLRRTSNVALSNVIATWVSLRIHRSITVCPPRGETESRDALPAPSSQDGRGCSQGSARHLLSARTHHAVCQLPALRTHPTTQLSRTVDSRYTPLLVGRGSTPTHTDHRPAARRHALHTKEGLPLGEVAASSLSVSCALTSQPKRSRLAVR